MLVLDCCAAVEIARQTPLGRLMRETIAQENRVISSTLLHAELAHVYQRYVQAGYLDIRTALTYLDASLQLVDEFVDTRDNCDEALSESVRYKHSSYDLFYLTLARRNACALMTADLKLAALCAKHGVECVAFSQIEA